MTALSAASELRAVTLSEAKGLRQKAEGKNRGVSSTVKLPVSKTGLGGSNPSAPAKEDARHARNCKRRRERGASQGVPRSFGAKGRRLRMKS